VVAERRVAQAARALAYPLCAAAPGCVEMRSKSRRAATRRGVRDEGIRRGSAGGAAGNRARTRVTGAAGQVGL
jgi:hypothetical protein